MRWKFPNGIFKFSQTLYLGWFSAILISALYPSDIIFSSIFISEILFFIWCELKLNVWDDFLISPQYQNSARQNKYLFSQGVWVRNSRMTWLGALVQGWLLRMHWRNHQPSQAWLRSHCPHSLKQLSAGPTSTSKCNHPAGGFLHSKQPKVA